MIWLNGWEVDTSNQVNGCQAGNPKRFGPWYFAQMDYIDTMNTREMTDKVTDKMQDWQRRATETARNLGQVTDKYVHENAWSSIALAAVLGCVVGYFLANRRD
jgi:hypothetical protein